MATRNNDFHYLRTNIERSEPRKYPSLESALAAMKDLLHLQIGRGFITTAAARIDWSRPLPGARDILHPWCMSGTKTT